MNFNIFPKIFPFITGLITFFYLMPAASAQEPTVLSDKELDGLCVGGFDFNLEAAYAYRAAIVNQSNLAVISMLAAANTTNINSANQTLVRSLNSSLLINQQNLSLLFSRLGDISNATINNSNFADIGDAVALKDQTGAVVNEAFTQAAGQIKQVNVTAVMAPSGKIDNVDVNNSNVINFDSPNSALKTNQSNITVFLAAGPINNSDVANSNIANLAVPVEDAAGQETGFFSMISASGTDSRLSVSRQITAAQENIVYTLSMVKKAVNVNAINERIRSLF